MKEEEELPVNQVDAKLCKICLTAAMIIAFGDRAIQFIG
jgi:hypothetical protein